MHHNVHHGYYPIQVGEISHAKQKRVLKTGKLHLTAHELSGSTHTLHLHPESHKKAHLAKSKGKGVHLHITHHEMHHNVHHGGSIFSKIGDFFRNNGTKILDTIAAVAPVLVPELTPFVGPARDLARTITGKGTRMVKGSAEAKAHMAHIRSQKKHSKGGSFISSGYT